MARKRVRNSEESRKAILKAAQEAFAKRGYHAAGVEQIAKSAGVAKGTVFLHFKNKEGLLFALVEGRFAGIERLYAELVRPEMSARRQLEELTRVEKWLKGEMAQFSRSLITLGTGLPPRLQRRMDAYIEKNYGLYRDRLAGLFRAFLGDEGLAGAGAESLAAAFMACMDGLLIRSRLSSLRPTNAQIGRAVREVFIENLAARADRPARPRTKRSRK